MNPIIKTLFEDENLWKEIYPNYKIRAGQIKLADEIYKTIKNQAFLIAEAGTGTGKTLAYLLPSLLYALEEKDYKILISTETKALQKPNPFQGHSPIRKTIKNQNSCRNLLRFQ